MKHADRTRGSEPNLGIEIDDGPDGSRAVYFRLTDRPVKRTVEMNREEILVDVDSLNHVVGVELTNPAKVDLAGVFQKIGTRFESFPLKQIPPSRIRRLQKLLSA